MLLIAAIALFSIVFDSAGRGKVQRGAPNQKGERTVVLAYNKPAGILTTHFSDDLLQNNQEGKMGENPRGTVYEDVMSMDGFVSDDGARKVVNFYEATGIDPLRSGLHAIGRLDADTTGLLLLTNDGGIVHHVTNPQASTHGEFAITKTYEALIMGHHPSTKDGPLSQLWHGVDIGAKYGGMTAPVHNLRILDHPTQKSTLVSITISEGRNRQVRRMFHAIQSGVMRLKRTAIGDGITLQKIENEGEWRILSEAEIKAGLAWNPRMLLVRNKTKRSQQKDAIRRSPRRQKRQKRR